MAAGEHTRRTLVRAGTLLCAAALVSTLGAGCSGSDRGNDRGNDDGRKGAPVTTVGSIAIDPAVARTAASCDPLDPRECLLPFPSDTFTRPDATSDTGRRVDFDPASMPANAGGVRIDPTEWNLADGFSPGQAISTYVPGLDPVRSGLPDVASIGASLADDAPVVLLDATTGTRWPYWTELDASVSDDADRVLYIRPARNFQEGNRIVVALRGLVDRAGTPIVASDGFRAYRDRLDTGVPAMEARRARYEQVFDVLDTAGVARDDLVLAWDFTVAGTRSLTRRMLHIRDDTFAALGERAPAFRVTQVDDAPDEGIARRVSGTFRVPLYLTGDGGPGNRFAIGADGLPARNGDYDASFVCIVPERALREPARAVVYGHGLLGSNGEVNAGNVRLFAAEHNIVFCATKWIGMADEDIANAARTLGEVSNFPTVADRLQQGVLNTLVLARLMKHPRGLVSDPAFRTPRGAPVIVTGSVFYDGNSQGGIMGGMATAVSTEWTRAVLGVTAMNYSTLLQRSTDWNTYRAIFEPAYPTVIQRGIVLSLIQMLWDRAEANGYANHMTGDPLPGTPEHRVLMHIALGDWQVSNWAANVQARTIGAALHCPALDDGALPGDEPLWGIPCLDDEKDADVNAMVYWDSGNEPLPLANVHPVGARDSHEDPRADADARVQKSEFLRDDGVFVDVCAGRPCTAEPAP